MGFLQITTPGFDGTNSQKIQQRVHEKNSENGKELATGLAVGAVTGTLSHAALSKAQNLRPTNPVYKKIVHSAPAKAIAKKIKDVVTEQVLNPILTSPHGKTKAALAVGAGTAAMTIGAIRVAKSAGYFLFGEAIETAKMEKAHNNRRKLDNYA